MTVGRIVSAADVGTLGTLLQFPGGRELDGGEAEAGNEGNNDR
jgi:hypothetical protein